MAKTKGNKAKAKAPVRAKKVRAKAGTSKVAAEHRRALFISAYITNGGNGTQAAITAGYSAKTAESQASRLLRDVRVKAEVEAAREAARQRFGLTQERVLLEVARLAFVDPRKFFNADGTARNITELDDDTAAALAGVEVLEEFEGAGKERVFIGYTKKYKLADKNAALDKAMKHLGLFLKDREQLGAAIGKAIIVPAKGGNPTA